ncbi:MAG TPA: LysM domain-containing protein, partial [Ilumatobacteraceae bacterium]
TAAKTSTSTTVKGKSSTSTTASPTTVDASAPGTYVVQPGDSLTAIAANVGTTVDAIVAVNGWTDGSSHPIFAGEKIKLPAKSG